VPAGDEATITEFASGEEGYDAGDARRVVGECVSEISEGGGDNAECEHGAEQDLDDQL